ncbi:MAG: hypothetical protein WA791_15095 [Rhodomicrobium sp.]
MNLSTLAYLITGRTLPRRRKKRRFRKPDPRRSPQYRAWIRTLDCLVLGCNSRPIHAAHTGTDGGIGTKASDWSCVPFCVGDHYVYHSIGKLEFETRYGLYLDFEVRRLNAEYVSFVSLGGKR